MYYCSEVINAQPIETRVEYIMKEVLKSNIVLGRVEKIRTGVEGKYAFVQIVSAENINLRYILDKRGWQIYCSFNGLSEYVKKHIMEGDLICFQPVLNDRKDEQIIKVDSCTVELLEDYDKLLEIINQSHEDLDIREIIAKEGNDNAKIWIRKEFSKRIQQINKELLESVKSSRIELESLQKEKELIRESINTEKKNILEERKNLNHLKDRLAHLGVVEFESKEDAVQIEVKKFNGTYIQLYDYIDKYIKNNEKLRYSKDIIRRFLIALQCRELIVFSGPSGTGKTSILKAFAKAFNGVAKIIAVKPNWTDSEDLLGFYNPVEKSYVATPFLDAIMEAKREENRDKIYLICLDEMNLAHIEYYFAEFLSKLEDNSANPMIELYSEEIYKDTLKEINQSISLMEGQQVGLTLQEMKLWCEQNSNEYKIDIAELIRKIRFVERYPAKFKIPRNVRFIGTINVDQTTKSISPKVIDRSFVIELLKESKERMYEKEIIEQQHVTIKALVSNDTDIEEKLLAYASSDAKDLNIYLQQMNVELNYRGEKHIGNYLEYAKCYINDEGQCEFLENTILSDVVYMKMLPRFNTAIRSSDDRVGLSWKEFRTRLEGVCSKDILEKVDKMNEGAEEDSILSFWGAY